MRLELSADQELLLDATRSFLRAEAPVTRIRDLASAPTGFDAGQWRQAAALGWTSMLVAEADGGGTVSGDGLADLLILAEALGAVIHPGPLVGTNVVAMALGESGTAAQKAGLLPGLLAGETVAAWATHEGSGGWSPDTIALRATPAGDGWRLTGTKTLVPDADVAGSFLVTARIDSATLAQFLVPAATAGVTIAAGRSLDLCRRLARVDFDVTVPQDALLGPTEGAREAIERRLDLAALLTVAQTLGALEDTFDKTVAYGLDRISFGRPILSYQALKHRLADARAKLEAAHGLTQMAAEAFSAGSPDTGMLVSAAKSYTGDLSLDLVQEAIQIHGGIGVTWEHDLHLYLRRVTVDRALYGDPAEHRERVAGLIGLDDAGARELAAVR